MSKSRLNSWALHCNFDKLINHVRNKLKKSDFIINIEKLMKCKNKSIFNVSKEKKQMQIYRLKSIVHFFLLIEYSETALDLLLRKNILNHHIDIQR